MNLLIIIVYIVRGEEDGSGLINFSLLSKKSFKLLGFRYYRGQNKCGNSAKISRIPRHNFTQNNITVLPELSPQGAYIVSS